MDFEFDKEIDVLLRQARRGEAVFAAANPAAAHLDADEISAFAENALPEKAKQNYTVHLADCDSCRKSLSAFILQSPELESETIRSPEKITIVSPPIPWYRKIFALPNLAYAFGALIVLFGGIIGFMVLQNSNNLQTSEVAKINDKPQFNEQTTSKSVSETPAPNSLANSNMSANINGGASYSANSALNSALTNSNASVPANPSAAAPPMPKMAAPTSENNVAAARKNDEKFSVDGAENEPKDKGFVNGVTLGRRNTRTQEDPREVAAADQSAPAPLPSVSRNQVTELPVNGRQMSDLKLSPQAKSALKKERNVTSESETSNVGGKNFARKDNVWYDANYKQQSTINITRGTEKYKKLDKDLRSIVENLGGTVVIVWKEKAYRIQ